MVMRGRRVALWSVLGVAALLVLALGLESAWLRPLAKAYVRQHAGRELEFDALRIGLDAKLQPVVTLRNLSVQNAAWASTKDPLIHAGELAATLSWASFWEHDKVITLLVLRDAQVDLETRADGLRNWRLGQPDDRGPGHMRVRAVDARGTRLRVVHEGLGLEISLATEPPAVAASGNDGEQGLAIHGVRHGVAFDGRLQAPALLTLYDTGSWFPAHGQLATAHARLGLQGRVHDLMQLGGLDGDLQVSGDGVGELTAVLGRHPLELPPFEAAVRAHLVKDGDHWMFTGLSGHLANSDATGTLDYRSNRAAGARPTLRATLVSERVDLAPWRSMAKDREASSAGPSLASPRSPLLDMDLDWKAGSVLGLPMATSDLHAVLSKHEGRWRVAPLDAALAGGRVSAQLSFDQDSQPATAAADVRVERLPLNAFRAGQVTGRVDAHVVVQAAGDSLQALLADASGEGNARLVGASLPATLEAKLGLDAGQWLEAVFSAGERHAITCSALQVQMSKGVAQFRRLTLQTDALLVNGVGALDLPKRSIDLTLTPHRRDATLLALDKSIRVEGVLGALKIGVVGTPENSRREPCTVAGTP